MAFPVVGSKYVSSNSPNSQEPVFRMGRKAVFSVKILSNGSMPERVVPVCCPNVTKQKSEQPLDCRLFHLQNSGTGVPVFLNSLALGTLPGYHNMGDVPST